MTLDIHEYVCFARGDEALFQQAREEFARVGATLFDRGDDEKQAITSSDAGRCGAQVAAEIAGLYDLDDADYASRDNGTLNGAWLACLLSVAIEARHEDHFCVLERSSAALNVSGHTDLGVYRRADSSCVHIVEFKCSQSWSVRPPHLPGRDATKTPANLHHVAQAAHRAMADGCATFTVYVKGDGEEHAQGDYEVIDGLVYLAGADDDTPSIVDVRAEYARVARGEKDAVKQYVCDGCRWSACERNPRRPLEAVLLASVEALT